MQDAQSNIFPSKSSLNCGGNLIDLSTPKVMGILNVTPDSFFDGGRLEDDRELLKRAEFHLASGATFLDIGGVSTRPRSEVVSESEEMRRLIPAIQCVAKEFPTAIISADTYRSQVAISAVDAGASMINDISGGTMDENMFTTVAQLQVPYVLMHIQGRPQTMQEKPTYEDVVEEVNAFFIQQTARLKSLGVHDIILDLGYGFGKTVEHNYELLKHADRFMNLGFPILAGLSRKSMINRVLGTKPVDALNGTTSLNTIALMKGASILRVHDVKEAMECIQLHGQLR